MERARAACTAHGALTPAAVGVAALCGALQATQTGVNLSLGTSMLHRLPREHAPDAPAAAFVSFLGGWALLIALNLAVDAWHRRADRRADAAAAAEDAATHGRSLAAAVNADGVRVRRYSQWRIPAHAHDATGGFLGVSVMLALLFTARTLGFALQTLARMLGTSAASIVMDHVGFLGQARRRATRAKVGGALIVLVGAALGGSGGSGGGSSSGGAGAGTHTAVATARTIGACALAVAAGAALPLQASVNRRCGAVVGGKLRGALVSFSGGVASLAVVVIIHAFAVAPEDARAFSLARARPWMFVGGALGAFSVSMNIALPPLIGLTLTFAAQTCGNLATALVLDALGVFAGAAHVARRPPTPARLVGVLVALAGVALVRAGGTVAAPPAAKDCDADAHRDSAGKYAQVPLGDAARDDATPPDHMRADFEGTEPALELVGVSSGEAETRQVA